MTATIGAGSRVTLHFELRLDDGEVIDSNFGGVAPAFVMGDRSLLPGFEAALLGLVSGDRGEALITAGDAFGQRHPDNIQRVNRSTFIDLEPEPGLVVSFQNGAEGELPGVVRALDGDEVEIDFNHPLAGRDILFRYEIVAVEPPA